MKLKKYYFVTRVLVAALVFQTTMCITQGKDTSKLIYAAESRIGQIESTTGIDVEYHSIDEVREYIRNSKVDINDVVTYDQKPVLKGEISMGAISQTSLLNALGTLNMVRYIAGLPDDVVLNKEYINRAQAGVLLNALNGELSHYPKRPAEVMEELYQLGAQGMRSSNIAFGYSNLCRAIIFGYMNDGDASNISRVGHRRWILNPSMDATGFGMVGNYQALYAFSMNGGGDESGVVWPAQSMPTDYFSTDYPWSISMGYFVDPRLVRVKLTRERDQKVWNFSTTEADGYFNVDNGGYGQCGCIIFRPDGIGNIADSDQYHVEISGLSTPVSYYVEFFDLRPVENVVIEEKSLAMVVGDYKTPHVTVTPENASNKNYEITSSNPSIVEVDEWGDLVAKSVGTAVVTATSADGKKSDAIKVTVSPEAESIHKIKISGSKQFTVYYNKAASADGYEIVYSTHPYFMKYRKVLTVKGNETTAKTVIKRNLKSRYYVKVRAYKIVDGKKYYGSYSRTHIISGNRYWSR